MRDDLARARAMGDRYEEDRLLGGLCELVQWLAHPAVTGWPLRRPAGAVRRRPRAAGAYPAHQAARLLALSGEIETAREDLEHRRPLRRRARPGLPAIAVTQVRGLVEVAGRRPRQRGPALFRDAAAARHAAGHGGAATTLEIYAARETLRLGDPAWPLQEPPAARGPAPAPGEVTSAHPAGRHRLGGTAGPTTERPWPTRRSSAAAADAPPS